MTSMWDRTARQIEADALEDLQGNKKFRSPAGQKFVRELRRYHTEQTDPLIPWLAREYRKGRLRHGVPLEEALRQHPVGRSLPDSMKDALREYDRYHIGALPEPPQVEGADLADLHHSITQWGNTAVAYNTDPEGEYLRDPPERWQTLTPDALSHWADWFHQPDRRKVPLDQLKAHELPAEVQKYETEKSRRMKDEAVEEGRHQGEIAHQWPDGWNVRSLPHGKALDFEAWHMRGDPEHPGHDGNPICVNWPQYQSQVEHGDKLIYSLRDPNGKPHVTMEINPTRQSPVPPLDFERLMNEHSVVANPELERTVRQPLRDYHAWSESGFQGPQPHTVTQFGVDNPGDDIRDLHDRLIEGWHARQERERKPLPHHGEIVQIQGKGNSVPKPEYQARMKDWFQTFPEEERPNWNVPKTDIEHIGAIYPEAKTWDDHYGYERVGDPNEDEDGAGMGGYGPHGDYGLHTPERAIDYDSVIDSLRRPRSYGESREGDYTHDDDEVQALYREALRRGEIPQLGDAVEKYSGKAMEGFSDLQDQNYDYLGHYPGESWEEDPDHWREQYEQQNHAPVEEDYEDPEEQEEALQALWKEQHEQYTWAENDLLEAHKPSQLANALRETLAPHFYPPDATTPSYHYRNDPKWPTTVEHLRPNTEGLTGQQLPKGSFYNNPAGGVSKVEDNWQPHASMVPTHVLLPGEAMPKTASATATAAPFRLLWAFGPSSGRTHLYDESDHHPAEAPTHDTIARDLGEVGATHGYAYSIPGGWRVLDYHHQPVADPFVRRQVVDRLRKRNAPPEAPSHHFPLTGHRILASFGFAEGDIERYHAGLSESDRRRPGFVTVHQPEFYRPPHRVFTTHDGLTGYSLLDHGDGRVEMAGVFNNGPRGRGAATVLHGLANGANYIECFERAKAKFSLPHFYHELTGALPRGYYPWDDQYAHPQWDYDSYGRPGLLEMHIPEHRTPNPNEFERRMAEVKGRLASSVYSDGLTGEDHIRAYDDWEEQTNRRYEEHQTKTRRSNDQYQLGDGGVDPNPTRSRPFIVE